jgi:acyl dehydratase
VTANTALFSVVDADSGIVNSAFECAHCKAAHPARGKNTDRKLAAAGANVYSLAVRASREYQLHVISSIEDAKSLEGVEVGLSDWVIIDQNRIDQFAEATGDYQWIHVDTERAAAEMPDGKTIAHGYLTLALIPALTGNFVEVKNLARAINFGVNKVRFYTPVRVGDRVRARATVLQARRRAGALLLTSETHIEVEDERKPACVAETLGMYFFSE